jgi:hypothetical protein
MNIDCSFPAVLFEFLTKHKDSPGSAYIRHCSLESNGTGFLIICFTADQARQFCKARSFQMDMTFKRVAGRVKEIAFVHMNETAGKGIYWFLFIIVWYLLTKT